MTICVQETWDAVYLSLSSVLGTKWKPHNAKKQCKCTCMEDGLTGLEAGQGQTDSNAKKESILRSRVGKPVKSYQVAGGHR